MCVINTYVCVYTVYHRSWLLSAHFVLGACFVVAKCHKRPCLMCLYNYVVFV